MSEREEPHSISYVRVERDSEKALLVIFDAPAASTPREGVESGGTVAEWIPKSQITDHDEVSKALSVAPWLLRAKGLIE